MIEILRADITTLAVDAIVNAANPTLGGGGGVDGAIHRAAGPELAPAAMALGPCPPGEAVLTPGFRLPSRFVIHAVGPIWSGGAHGEADTLRRTYERAFAVAREEGSIRSIAFPAISTGVYGFPKREAAAIALDVMQAHTPHFERIIACLFDDESLAIYQRVLADQAAHAVAHQWYMRPVLFVSDVQRAIDFYVGKLGFVKKWHEADGKGTVCQVDRGGCEIILSQDAARKDRARLFLELTREGVDELQREIAERSVAVEKTWWGYDVLRIEDPDGNELLVCLEW